MKSFLAWIVSFFYRPADFTIGQPDNPYMLRWYIVPRNRWFNVYLHKVLRSDDDRALHDHPWASLSVLLRGKYIEVTPHNACRYSTGNIIYRSSKYSHRLVVEESRPCWTLFITGPKVREWGFWCRSGWIPWQQFVNERSPGETGGGCADE